jgi:hypothetical protein
MVLHWAQRDKTPSPLVGEGWGGGDRARRLGSLGASLASLGTLAPCPIRFPSGATGSASVPLRSGPALAKPVAPRAIGKLTQSHIGFVRRGSGFNRYGVGFGRRACLMSHWLRWAPGATGCPQPVPPASANARVPCPEPVAPTTLHRSLGDRRQFDRWLRSAQEGFQVWPACHPALLTRGKSPPPLVPKLCLGIPSLPAPRQCLRRDGEGRRASGTSFPSRAWERGTTFRSARLASVGALAQCPIGFGRRGLPNVPLASVGAVGFGRRGFGFGRRACGLVGSGCQRACSQGNHPEIIIERGTEPVPSLFRATRSRSGTAGNRWRTLWDRVSRIGNQAASAAIGRLRSRSQTQIVFRPADLAR